MTNNKKNLPAQAGPSSDDDSRLEQARILKHMITRGAIHTYKAYALYGIRDCRTLASRINEAIPVADKWILKPHPTTGIPTKIKLYWLEADTVKALKSPTLVEALAKQQESAKIAKHRSQNLKVFEEMCSYSKRETIEKRLDEIYGKIAANDD